MEGEFSGFGSKAIPFLKALDFHQSREWFLENRELFEKELRDPLGDLVETLTRRFSEADLGLRGDRKKSLFRINRDVRFAKDKRPYNRHLSAILSPDGSKMERGVFYVHIGLERCFAGVAWWQTAGAAAAGDAQGHCDQASGISSDGDGLEERGSRARCRRPHETHPAWFRRRDGRRPRGGNPKPAFRRPPRDRSGWNSHIVTGRRTPGFHAAGQAVA
jgi:hypothetical protein